MAINRIFNATINSPYSPIRINNLSSGVVAIRATPSGINRLAGKLELRVQQFVIDGAIELKGETKRIPISGENELLLFEFKGNYSIVIGIPEFFDSMAIQVFQVSGFQLTNQAVIIGGGGMTNFDASLYYLKTDIDSLLAGKADSIHNHDSRYYQKTEVDAKIAAIPASGGGSSQFQFKFPGDTFDLTYWIGTNAYSQAFANPHNSGELEVISSSWQAGFALGNFVARGRTEQSATDNSVPNPWIGLNLKNRRFKPNGYSIKARDFGSSLTHHWSFEVSSDAVSWAALDDIGTETLYPNSPIYRSVTATQGYQYFRVKLQEPTTGGDWYLGVQNLQLYGDLIQSNQPSS